MSSGAFCDIAAVRLLMNLLCICSHDKQIEGIAAKHVCQKSANSVCIWVRARKQKQCLGLANSPNDDKHKTQNDSLSSISVGESDNHLREVMQSAWTLFPVSYSSAPSFVVSVDKSESSICSFGNNIRDKLV